VKRIVYTSTVARSGSPPTGRRGRDTPVSLGDMVGPYKASKFLAEQAALEFARAGLPVVVVNPSAPIGPWDVKPSRRSDDRGLPRGRMFASLDTGLNLVHVRDVARGHLLAAERGPSREVTLGDQRTRC